MTADITLFLTTGSTTDWTTITFDPTQAYRVATRTGASASPHTYPAVPAEMNNSSPNSTIRMAALNVGDTSGNDDGLDGYYDNVVVAEVDGTTIYDFEAVQPIRMNVNKAVGKITDLRIKGNAFAL